MLPETLVIWWADQNSPTTPDESLRNTTTVSPIVGLLAKLDICIRAAFVGTRSKSARVGASHTTDEPSTPRKVIDIRSKATISPAADDTPRISAEITFTAVRSSRRTSICCVVRWKNRCCPTMTAVTMVPSSPSIVMVTSSSMSVNPLRRGRFGRIIGRARSWYRSQASSAAEWSL